MQPNYFRTFLSFGLWILLLLYLRIPAGWKDAIWVLTALALFYQAYREHMRRQQSRTETVISTGTFAESIKDDAPGPAADIPAPAFDTYHGQPSQ